MEIITIQCDMCKLEIQPADKNEEKMSFVDDQFEGELVIAAKINHRNTDDVADLCPACIFRILEAGIKKVEQELSGAVKDFGG